MALAGDVHLPLAIDDWGRAAGLLDLGGDPLAESLSPLTRVATGRPVAGEPVRVSRPGAETADGEPAVASQLWWVTGFPLTDLGSPEQLALVAFFEVDDAGAREEDVLTALRDRAVIATDLSFTITDPHTPDEPLVWVNPAFTRMTGYTLEEVMGRNCRFLQGDATTARRWPSSGRRCGTSARSPSSCSTTARTAAPSTTSSRSAPSTTATGGW